MVHNSLNRFLCKIGIINPEIVVKPASLYAPNVSQLKQLGVRGGWNLILGQFVRDESLCPQQSDDIAKLLLLACKSSVRVSRLLTDLVIGLVAEGEVSRDRSA